MAKHKKELTDELGTIKKSLVELYLAQSKSTMQRELDLDSCKKQLLKYLPLNEVGPAVDILFTAPESRRAIKETIKMKLTSKGMQQFNERQLALEAIKMCFTSYMRAHFFLNSANFKK